MNHRILFLVTACVLGGGAMVALNACGDDDAAIPPAGDDAGGASSSGSTSSSSSSGSTSGGTSSGTSGGTSSGDPDSGTDGGASSSGAISNPGKITCGAAECTIGTQLCCRGLNDAGCIAENDNCQGAEIECDEKADCPDQDDSCCLDFAGIGSGLRARCENNCMRRFQICKTAAECGDAGCVEKTCGQGANAIKIRTCGPVAGSGCQ